MRCLNLVYRRLYQSAKLLMVLLRNRRPQVLDFGEHASAQRQISAASGILLNSRFFTHRRIRPTAEPVARFNAGKVCSSKHREKDYSHDHAYFPARRKSSMSYAKNRLALGADHLCELLRALLGVEE